MEIINYIVEFKAFRFGLIELLHGAIFTHPGVNPNPIGPRVKNDLELFFLRSNVNLCENLHIFVIFDRSGDQLLLLITGQQRSTSD